MQRAKENGKTHNDVLANADIETLEEGTSTTDENIDDEAQELFDGLELVDIEQGSPEGLTDEDVKELEDNCVADDCNIATIEQENQLDEHDDITEVDLAIDDHQSGSCVPMINVPEIAQDNETHDNKSDSRDENLVNKENVENENRKDDTMNQTIGDLEKNIIEENGGPVVPIDRNGIEIKVGDHLWCGGWNKELCTVVGVGDRCFFAEVSDDDVDDATSMPRVYKHNVTEDNQVSFVHPAVDTVDNLVECIDTHYGNQLVPVDEMIERFRNLIAKARNEELAADEQ